ncbi:MAG: hypothetical protein LC643_09805, partial [Bacteroidales bacterium]|nr:hypothetical protein [Bacteroidales bacterium]
PILKLIRKPFLICELIGLRKHALWQIPLGFGQFEKCQQKQAAKHHNGNEVVKKLEAHKRLIFSETLTKQAGCIYS